MAHATKKPGEVLRKTTPGRFQVQVHYYNRERRAFRPVPAHALTFDVQTPAEVRRLFVELERVVSAGAWREPGSGTGDAGNPDAVRDVAAKKPVDE